jgi:HEAT repeat protein
MGCLGPKAVPALLELLKSDDEQFRSRAAQALGAIGADAKAAIPALKEASNDKDVEVRLSAKAALRRIEAMQRIEAERK